MKVLDLFCGAGGAAMGYCRKELSQSIPPAYTEWIGKQMMQAAK